MTIKKKKNKDLLKFGAFVLLIIFGFLLGTGRQKITKSLFSGKVLVSEEISAKELNKLLKDKNAEIVLYCKSGKMSADALTTLKSLGYKNVRHLAGGMDSWKDEGFNLLDLSNLSNQILPEEGFELPISWSDMGPKLVSLGVIDKSKFEKAVKMDEGQKE